MNVRSHQNAANAAASPAGSASAASAFSDSRAVRTAGASTSGRKKYPWTPKRVLAWLLIIALVSMYLASSPAAGSAFRASLLLTIALPVIVWILIWAIGVLQRRTSIASLRLLNSNPQARKEMEQAVQESEKKKEEKNDTPV